MTGVQNQLFSSLLLLCGTSTVLAQGESLVFPARLEPVRQIDVSPAQAGHISQLDVSVGQMVKQNQLLVAIDEGDLALGVQEAKLEYELARRQAESQIGIQAAAAELNEANRELSLLRAVGRVPEIQVTRAAAIVEIKHAALDAAKLDQLKHDLEAELAANKLNLLEQRLASCRRLAPFSGAVVSVNKSAGEWCAPGDTLLRIVHLEKLQLVGRANARTISPHQLCGLQVSASMLLADKESPLEIADLTVDRVAAEVAPDGSYEFWIEIRNQPVSESKTQWLLLPGMEASLQEVAP